MSSAPAPYVHGSLRKPGAAGAGAAKPWERGGTEQAKKVAETTEWLKSQRKKLMDGFDPVKTAAEREKAPPTKGGVDPLIAKLRSMGEKRGRGMEGVMQDNSTEPKKLPGGTKTAGTARARV